MSPVGPVLPSPRHILEERARGQSVFLPFSNAIWTAFDYEREKTSGWLIQLSGHGFPTQSCRSDRVKYRWNQTFQEERIPHRRDEIMVRWLLTSILLLIAFGPRTRRASKLEPRRSILHLPGFPCGDMPLRRDKPSEGVLDPLYARAIVFKTGESKIARQPGSCELLDPRRRKSETHSRTMNSFPGQFAYSPRTCQNWTIGPRRRNHTRESWKQNSLVSSIRADAARVPARYGVASTETPLNRNRQSKRPDKPVDNELLVLRF